MKVNRYRPWTDAGDSPILENLDRDGEDIDPDYDTVVVLAADYDKALSLLRRVLPTMNPKVMGDTMREISKLLSESSDRRRNENAP